MIRAKGIKSLTPEACSIIKNFTRLTVQFEAAELAPADLPDNCGNLRHIKLNISLQHENFVICSDAIRFDST